MKFGDILAEWEKNAGNKAIYKQHDKDLEQSEAQNSTRENRSRLLRKKPDAVIDLHGLKQDEAWAALKFFFDDAKRKGFEKLLIIHGKGNHTGFSGSEGVLKTLSRQFIESCPGAGESGYSSNRDGGSGATWVILKS